MLSHTRNEQGLQSTSCESLTFEIASAVALERGVDPVDLPPLNEYVDVDGLVTLFESTRRHPASEITVSFRYDGQQVEVAEGGRIDVASDAPSEGGE